MTKYEIKIKNSLNLPCHANKLFKIESSKDLLKVNYNKYDELLIISLLIVSSSYDRSSIL